MDFKPALETIKKHSPEILTGIGIVCFAGCAVASAIQVPKAVEALKGVKDEDISNFDKIKLVAPHVFSPAILFAIGTTCFITATRIGVKRTNVMELAYTKLKENASKFEEGVISKIGEDGYKEVKRKITENDMRDNPPPVEFQNRETKPGVDNLYLIYDTHSGRYFESNRNEVDRIVNITNEEIRNGNFVSLNDFYWNLGLEPVKLGDEFGWDKDHTGYIVLDWDSCIEPNTGKPALTIDYNCEPVSRLVPWRI